MGTNESVLWGVLHKNFYLGNKAAGGSIGLKHAKLFINSSSGVPKHLGRKGRRLSSLFTHLFDSVLCSDRSLRKSPADQCSLFSHNFECAEFAGINGRLCLFCVVYYSQFFNRDPLRVLCAGFTQVVSDTISVSERRRNSNVLSRLLPRVSLIVLMHSPVETCYTSTLLSGRHPCTLYVPSLPQPSAYANNGPPIMD